MHLLATFRAISAVLCVLLGSCREGRAEIVLVGPVQPQPLSPEVTCTNCNYNPNIPTLNSNISQAVLDSPLYQVIVTMTPGEPPIDSVCITYFPLNGINQFLEFIVYVYSTGAYSVSAYIVSDTCQGGVTRVQGLESIGVLDASGVSSAVANVYAIGSVSCVNCTSLPLVAFYNGVQFADCSLLSESSSAPDLFVLSNTPDISTACLNEAEALFAQAGFAPGQIAYPPHLLHRRCIASFNGAPCINAGSVPPCDRLEYPPPCGCRI